MGVWDWFRSLWTGSPPGATAGSGTDSANTGGANTGSAAGDGTRSATPINPSPFAPKPATLRSGSFTPDADDAGPVPGEKEKIPADKNTSDGPGFGDLSLGQFAPLSNAEVQAEAGSAANLLQNVWFGRRDLIPPVSDPRTLLIDRAMVGQGLIAPEELAEIHRVGDEMGRLRPDISWAWHTAQQAARAAVAAEKATRQANRDQKKAEAAAKRAALAQAVAHRKQTDILFLGRSVSSGLADRRSHLELLEAQQLPRLSSPADVADALKISIPRLRWLCFHSEAAERIHYVRFTVPKKSGGNRELAAPHANLAQCQEWILREVLEKIPLEAAAHGFVRGRSTVTNAAAHVGQAIVANLDLSNFFPTIAFPRVRGLFRKLGYSPAAATIFALLCTEAPRRTVNYAGQTYHVATGPRALPQGACTSPALSNLVSRKMDRRLTGIAHKLGWKYTRYADDLTFSADAQAADKLAYLLARVRHIADDEGFAVNERKTRILRPNTAQEVTGIIVNQRPGVPRELVRRLRAILHRARQEGLAAQNRAGHPHFESWVRGMIAYIHMVNPDQARPLRAALEGLGSSH